MGLNYDRGWDDGHDKGKDEGRGERDEDWRNALEPLVLLLAAFDLAEGQGDLEEPEDVAKYLPPLAKDLIRHHGRPSNPELIEQMQGRTKAMREAVQQVRDATHDPARDAWRNLYVSACVVEASSPGLHATSSRRQLETLGQSLGVDAGEMESIRERAMRSCGGRGVAA